LEKFLWNAVGSINEYLKCFKELWTKTGCTIMSNGWCYPPICMDILGVKFLCHFQAINNEEGEKEAVCATLALKSILDSIEVVQG